MPINTIEDLEVALERLIGDFPLIVQRQTEVAAGDIMALVDQRIVETGTDERGGAFEDYTPSYKAKKTKAGRYRGKVDFQLTGQMLASTGTGLVNIVQESSTVSGAVATVIIAGRDKETQDKIEGNNRKRPGFLNPSPKEIDRVENIRTKRIEEMIVETYFR